MEEVVMVGVGCMTDGRVVLVVVTISGGLTGGLEVEGFGFAVVVGGGFGFGFVVGSMGSGIATARFSRWWAWSLLWLFLVGPMSLARASIVV